MKAILEQASSEVTLSREWQSNRERQLAISLFVVGLVGLGILSVVYRDFAYGWQPVPASIPGRQILAGISGLFMIAAGLALLFRATAVIAIRILFPYLLIWQLLKVPALLVAPRMEAVWLGFGEIAVLLAGGWVLFAQLSRLDRTAYLRHIVGEKGMQIAFALFALALLPIGLSHIVYVKITAALVPAWLPLRTLWAYVTGIGQIACGLGVLFFIWARAAAMIEAAMLALFALLVWGPASWLATQPKFPGMPTGPRFALTAFFITWIIGASACIIATNIPSSAVRSATRRSA